MCTLLQCAIDHMKVSRTDSKPVVLTYACTVKSIMRVWKRRCDTITRLLDFLDVRSKIKGKNGKVRIYSYAVHIKMEAAPYRKRCTLRSLTHVTGALVSTICRMRQRNDIMATTNAIKPLLTEDNKRVRIHLIVRFADESKML